MDPRGGSVGGPQDHERRASSQRPHAGFQQPQHPLPSLPPKLELEQYIHDLVKAKKAVREQLEVSALADVKRRGRGTDRRA